MRGFCARTVLVGISVLSLAAAGCAKKPATGSEEPTSQQPEPERPAPPVETPPAPPPTDWEGQIRDVFFDYDKYELRSDARAVLQENGRMLKENSGATMVLEGHCDERGTEEYNLALGQRRADAVLNYLKDLGVTTSGIQTMSYGEERPFSQGHEESAWSQNRRVHFRFQ